MHEGLALVIVGAIGGLIAAAIVITLIRNAMFGVDATDLRIVIR